MNPLYYVGLTLHAGLFVALVGTCAFDEGRLAHDWTDCLIPLGFLLLPMILALVGGSRRSRGMLVAASVTGGILGVLFLHGPGLFLLGPALCYGGSAASFNTSPPTRPTQ